MPEVQLDWVGNSQTKETQTQPTTTKAESLLCGGNIEGTKEERGHGEEEGRGLVF